MVLLISGLIYVFRQRTPPADLKRPVVTASFYPIYFLAKEIMGDRGTVYNLTPAGAEPHDYELTSGDRIKLEKSDLILLNGGKLESWGDGIVAAYKNDKNKRVLKLAEPLMFDGDPHVWLDPSILEKEAEVVAKNLAEIDPKNAKYYWDKLEFLLGQLDLMDKDFMVGLGNCDKNQIITAHEAFGYLARRYGFTQYSIAGLSPDAEPSARAVADITDYAKKNNIKYIFFESLVSPKLSETVAREAGATTLVLNPLEGLTDEEVAQNQNYFTEMRKNLNNLKTAMLCR